MTLLNEVFALRAGERLCCYFNDQPATGCWIAVMLRSVKMLEGEWAECQHLRCPPAPCAIIAAEKNSKGEWLWLQLSPATKEAIVLFLLDKAGVPFNRWVYIEVVPAPRDGKKARG